MAQIQQGVRNRPRSGDHVNFATHRAILHPISVDLLEGPGLTLLQLHHIFPDFPYIQLSINIPGQRSLNGQFL